MTLKLTIQMDNAAFEESPDAECARILRNLASKVEVGERSLAAGESFSLLDINGNKVGKAEVVP